MDSVFTPVSAIAIAIDATRWVLAALMAVVLTLILAKAVQLGRASACNQRFVAAFRLAPGLESTASIESAVGGCASIAEVGLGVLRHERGAERQEHLKRNLERQARREQRRLEGGLGLLASVGSMSIWVGLSGTVWGIMTGPIEAALSATGVGIAVAIPAMLASRYFELRVKTMAADLDDFVVDFLNLADRTVSAAGYARPRNVFRPSVVSGSGKTP